MNNTATHAPSTPKFVFLHLLMMVLLYGSAAAFLTLIFQYANILLPDKLEGGMMYRMVSYRGAIRFAISSIIVVFPVFMWVSWYLNKSYDRMPELLKFRIRKWLIYFTLFAAALFIIGDLVRLVYVLLGGEVTARFLIKVAAVLFVAGSIFGYYLWDLRRRGEE